MILAIDQGTSSSRAFTFDNDGRIRSSGQVELAQHYPQAGWVEHDPEEIWQGVVQAIQASFAQGEIDATEIRAIGITNQRETSVVWDRRTGKPIYNAIVWQDRRTAPMCQQLHADGLAADFRERTGLIIDPYFSATKIRWILDNVEGAQRDAQMGHLAFGTIDSWLIWKLTGGATHATDYTNASRTMLFNIGQKNWDTELLARFDIPSSMMPQVKFSSVLYGHTRLPELFPKSVTISGVAGDQQSALYGQYAFEPGKGKVTYGTGCFILEHTGDARKSSEHGLLTTVAVDQHGGPAYALEGAVFNAGSAVQWLRDNLGIIASSEESEAYASQIDSNLGVYFVPAFSGLGAPYWNANARGSIFGLTRGVARHHIVRATLESIAYQSADVLDVMVKDSGRPLQEIRADGGAANNDFLMQFQADICNVPVVRPAMMETTVAGAALLAGIGAGVWTTPSQPSGLSDHDRVFEPSMSDELREDLRDGWRRAVKAAIAF
jgi:glycerol kinase